MRNVLSVSQDVTACCCCCLCYTCLHHEEMTTSPQGRHTPGEKERDSRLTQTNGGRDAAVQRTQARGALR